DVFAERPLLVFGKWKGEAAGSINIEGMTGKGKYACTLNVAEHRPDAANEALAYLWARERISVLDDYASLETLTASKEEEVTALGLKYNLLTRYTSFVAIDSEKRNIDGIFTSINQELPLPEGVSHNAVGGIFRKSIRGISECAESRMKFLTLETDDNEFQFFADEPRFTGHPDGIEAFVREHMIYPADALEKRLEGLVYVEFFVEPDGSVSDIIIITSSDIVFENEAKRLILLTDGMWRPTGIDGRKSREKKYVEIHFELE
ncbi:MAG TPA: energy transducer TonB, partial [Bacteroidales bacterium]|nr:energy transducer TonB [Bacteroidales bacterium]